MAELAKNVDNGDGAALSTSGDVEGPSLEELQAQLAEMEATQSELASRLQIQSENAEPRLDHRLAAIEEQFRSSFDDRLRAGSGSATFPSSIPARSTSDADLLVINRIFREVSRLMADEWRPVFDILIAGFNEEIVNAAKESLETQPSLIQGYKALLMWKELSGDQFDIWKLINVLKQTNMEDIADTAAAVLEGRDVNDNKAKTTKPVQRRKSDVTSRPKTYLLDNRRILLLAKKVGTDWEPLGKALGVPDEELNEIKEDPDGTTYQGAFKMLWAWRQTQPSHDEAASTDTLRRALQQVNKGQLFDQLAAN